MVNFLASGDSDGRIAVWQLSDTPNIAPAIDDLPPNKENWILNHDSEVTSVAWSPDGKLLASVSNDESLLVHDVTSVNFLASGDSDGRIAVWQLSDTPNLAPAIDDLPPNKENWHAKAAQRKSTPFRFFWVVDGEYCQSDEFASSIR
ncbi:WD domain, G-beta repeat protein [Teladorsagia circumcincta]|uniref:WD domain, G-beta repeat protein n=1 Tax=Teladorsagia circumcincta TaxID=45464 RepID=A0A2G9TRN6_TELCI|nr:WD domain, G-beta repeat protein [Teladorsagia circumcincta]